MGVRRSRWRAGKRALDVFVLKLESNSSSMAMPASPPPAAPRHAPASNGAIPFASTAGCMQTSMPPSPGPLRHNAPPDDLGCSAAAPSHPCAQPIAITGRYIPNSPTNVIDAGFTAAHPSGWFGALKARHFGESPLVEDDSARSPPYTTVDAQFGYQRPGKWLLAADVFNLVRREVERHRVLLRLAAQERGLCHARFCRASGCTPNTTPAPPILLLASASAPSGSGGGAAICGWRIFCAPPIARAIYAA